MAKKQTAIQIIKQIEDKQDFINFLLSRLNEEFKERNKLIKKLESKK